MTLPYSPSIATFNGNGVATQFPFSFKVWEMSQLVVSVVSPEGIVEQMPFTVALTESGGTVTFLMNNAPLPTGWRLSVMRDMPFDQEVDLITGTRFDPQVIEDALDEATAERQQLREAVGRAIVVPPGDERPPELLSKEIFDARDQALTSAANAALSEAHAEAAAVEAVEARDTALEIIGTATAEGVAAIQVAGEAQLHNIAIAGNNIQVIGLQTIEAVKNEGESQVLRVRAEAGLAVNGVIAEGDRQSERLELEASQHIAQAANEADRSSREADRAERAADKAVDMTGVGLASKEHWGICRVGEGLTVENGIINASHTKIVSTPVISFPNAVGVGFAYALTLSASTGAPGAVVTKFVLSVDGAAPVELQAVNGKGTTTVMVEGIFESTGTLSVVAHDSYGNTSLQAVTSYVKKDVQVQPPRIISPAQGDVDVALKPLIILQPAYVTGIQATPTRTQVQIARDAEFANLVFDSGQVPYDTSIQVTVELPDFAQFYARARHEVEFYGWSAWRATQSFTTIAKALVPCTILAPPQGSTGQSLTPTIVLTAMVSTGIVDSPANTQVQIARDSTHTQILHDTGLAAPYSTSIVSPTLPINTQIFVRARHRGQALGWGQWSVVHSFVTLNAFIHTPSIMSPAEGERTTTLRPTLGLSAFAATNSNVGGSALYSPRAMDVQIATDAAFGNLVVNYNGAVHTAYTPSVDLPENTTLYCRLRHTGFWTAPVGQPELVETSAWSATRAFVTVDAYTNTPLITAPAAGSTSSTLRPTVNISAFGWAGVADTPANTHLQVSRDAGFSNLLLDTGEGGMYTTTYTPPADWPLGAQLWVRARHRGARWGWSAWSPVVAFTVLSGYIAKPTIIYPTSPLLWSDKQSVFGSAFSSVGGDSFKNATLTLRKGADAPIYKSGAYVNFDILDIPVGTYQATLNYQGNFLPPSGEGPIATVSKAQYRHVMKDSVNNTIVDGITLEEISPVFETTWIKGLISGVRNVFGGILYERQVDVGQPRPMSFYSYDHKTRTDFTFPGSSANGFYTDNLITYRGKCYSAEYVFNSLADMINGNAVPHGFTGVVFRNNNCAITNDHMMIFRDRDRIRVTSDFVTFETRSVPGEGSEGIYTPPNTNNLAVADASGWTGTSGYTHFYYSFDNFKTYATMKITRNARESIYNVSYINGTFCCSGDDRVHTWKWGDATATNNTVGGCRQIWMGADGWLYGTFYYPNTGNVFNYAKSTDGIHWAPIASGSERYQAYNIRYIAKAV